MEPSPSSRVIPTVEDEEEYLCPLCYYLMAEPIMTPCNHSFCHKCILDSRAYAASCPLCRADFPESWNPTISKSLQTTIKNKFPTQFNQRKTELATVNQLQATKLRLYFACGNRHELVTNPRKARSNPAFTNKHCWTMYVKLKTKNPRDTARNYIRKVVYGLDPSFGATEVIVKQEPFELTKKGWGTFEVPIKIYWERWMKLPPMEIDHDLSFDGNGSHKGFFVEIDNKLIPETLSNSIAIKRRTSTSSSQRIWR